MIYIGFENIESKLILLSILSLNCKLFIVSTEGTTESATAIENIKTGVEEVDSHVIQISIILIAVIIALAFILIKKGNKPEE